MMPDELEHVARVNRGATARVVVHLRAAHPRTLRDREGLRYVSARDLPKHLTVDDRLDLQARHARAHDRMP